ncbi:MAG: cytochrome c biogenesis protein CcsA [Phycisphaerales bacterium]|nr:cytochrome c biogenesis protein CcsA [Phycisphaerales bacterium]
MILTWLQLVSACLWLLPSEDGAAPALDLTVMAQLPVQHDGRWMPLDTLARDVVESTTGTMHYEGRDPVYHLLAWTFDPQTAMKAPLIPIKNAELRRELQLSDSATWFSYDELMKHKPLQDIIAGLSNMEEGHKPDPLESKAGDISEKLELLRSVFRGEMIRLIPDPKNAGGAWRAIRPPQAQASETPRTPSAVWGDVKASFLAAEPARFRAACDELAALLRSMPAAYRPDPALLAREIQYNKLHAFRYAWIIMLAAALVSALSLRMQSRWPRAVALIALLAGFGVLTLGMAMRWQIAGRIPASNMFESLLFLGWGTGAFAILSMLVMRDRLAPLTASAMGAVALVLADVLPLDSFVRPIAPVLLDTVWMSIHVPIIMLSYSVLALAVLIAHAQLIALAFSPSNTELVRKIDTLHYWYVHVGSILLTAGIITGSMWAASSWGRYWGWDPKEVWSLVALLGYLTILHIRIPHDRIPAWGYAVGALVMIALAFGIAMTFASITLTLIGALAATVLAVAYFIVASGCFATAVKSIAAFWLILMTYVGVNYILGTGLHSYGFGTGAMARLMLMAGTADLLLIAVLWVVHFWNIRRRGSGMTLPRSDAAHAVA